MNEHNHNRSTYISLVAVSLLIAGCAHHHNVAQLERSDEPELTPLKYRLSPTPDEDQPGGVYVPKNLDDSFVELKRMLRPDFVAEFKETSEEDTAMHHFGLGMWMRNNWGLWRGARLAKWFNAHGIEHPDDMSSIILDSFWRHLNGQPLQLPEQVAHYKQYWLEATPPDSPCPLCEAKLDWVGGGGELGHGLTCKECKRGFTYHYQRGLEQLPISEKAARLKAEKLLRQKELSANVAVLENKLERFIAFEVKKDEGCRFNFGMAGYGMGSTDRLVWSFVWRGQDIEEPLDNLMWLEIDAETGRTLIWFARLKSERASKRRKAQQDESTVPVETAPSAPPTVR